MRSKKEGRGASREDGSKRVPDEPFMRRGTETSRNGVYLFACTMFALGFAVVFCLSGLSTNLFVLLGAAALGFALAFNVRIAPQWERVVVLRLGKFNRVAGPGPYATIPLVEHASARVDQRIITTPFTAEEALTADLVPLDIDSVLFWMVWSPKDACIEVEDYASAIWWAAQTALRDAVGRINLAEVATRREQLDNEIKEILDEKTRTWGITVVSVEIRDISIPKELQDAMSREAQAERERNARLLLAEVEKDISEMFVDAAAVYDQNEKAMQLRTMNLIYESVKEKGGLVIAPSAFGDAFNNISSFAKPQPPTVPVGATPGVATPISGTCGTAKIP